MMHGQKNIKLWVTDVREVGVHGMNICMKKKR